MLCTIRQTHVFLCAYFARCCYFCVCKILLEMKKRMFFFSFSIKKEEENLFFKGSAYADRLRSSKSFSLSFVISSS